MGIQIRNLHKVFRDPRTKEEIKALEDINIDINDKEFFCLLGPSGCGKSTILNVMAGFELPTSGTIQVDSHDPSRPLTAMVFQEHALFPWLTVIQNILFGPSVRYIPKAEQEEIAKDLIAIVGLEGFESKYPHELSGGMRQRVALARALANDAEVLLMDEPFASVDFQTRRILQKELLRIWSLTEKTIVYVTHDVPEAVLLADRIAILSPRPGRIKRIFNIDLPRERHEWDCTASSKEIFECFEEDVFEK